MAQQILKEVDGSFKSFFGLLKKAKQGKHALKDCRLPRYLPKDGYTTGTTSRKSTSQTEISLLIQLLFT